MDGYQNVNDLKNIVTQFFSDGKTTRRNIIRDRALFLCGHASIARGQVIRGIELSDLAMYRADNQGPHECPVTVLLSQNGKDNSFNRKDMCGMIRHKEFTCCSRVSQ